ncbi:hypothetical protein TPA0908_32850 [Micromonospora sp. AKA38]|nr:hypothetical protein TPA0908_32850 [Micromonospora sp. AKA38]
MSERLIDVVAEPGRPGISRWRAVTPSGVVAGVVDLRPVLPFDDESSVAVRAAGLGLDLHSDPGAVTCSRAAMSTAPGWESWSTSSIPGTGCATGPATCAAWPGSSTCCDARATPVRRW